MEIPAYQPFYIETLDALRAEIDRLGPGVDIPLDEDLSILATPHTTGPAIVPNRFCAQPITGCDANPDGSPGDLTLRRYRRYAHGGFGLIWVESTTPGGGAIADTATPGRLRLHEETLPAFQAFIRNIRDTASERWQHDVVLILQLATPVTAPVHLLPGAPDDTPLLPDENIAAARDELISAGALAAEAGFDGVDVQCCHGSLAGALLGAHTREGSYGGPLENRARFVNEVFSGIRKEAPGLLLATRLCAYDAVRAPYGFGADASDYRRDDLAEPVQLVRALRESGLGLLNVTAASPNLRAPSHERPVQPHADAAAPDEHPLTVLARQLRIAGALRDAAPGLPVVGSGFGWVRQFVPEIAAAAINANAIDFVGMGRGALAYPEAPADILGDGRMRAESACMICFACELLRAEGAQVGCVIRDSATYGQNYRGTRRFSADRLIEEAQRCHFCEAAPCVHACPTHPDIPAFLKAFIEGDHRKAYEIIRQSDVLPELTSHVSPGWLLSQGACVETTLTGVPIPILDIQYTLCWQAREQGITGVRLPCHSTGKRIAVVGGGPAGLAAAIRLLEMGHAVDLFEHDDTLGGTPERVIPSRRLPPTNPEIDAILEPALVVNLLHLHFGATLGGNLDLQTLCRNHDAILLAAGFWQEQPLEDTGSRPEGVVDALSFLESAKHGDRASVPDRVAVLSGGDCAMDAATTAKRLGARELFIVFGGPRAAMHWHMPEEWFATPGVHALMFCRPLGYETGDGGALEGVRVRHTELDHESVLEVGLVIEAMGLGPAESLRAALSELDFGDDGKLLTTEGCRTNLEHVYAAGALVNGGSSVVQCVAEGMGAAERIDKDLTS